MKKLTVLFLLLPLIAFAQSTKTITFTPNASSGSGQGTNGTVPDTSLAFAIWKGRTSLNGLLVDQGFARQLKFLVSEDGTNYFVLQHPDTTDGLYLVGLDSTVSGAVKLDASVFEPWSLAKVIVQLGAGVGSVSTIDTTITGIRRNKQNK